MIPNYWVIFIYKLYIFLLLCFYQTNKDGEKKYDGEKYGKSMEKIMFFMVFHKSKLYH